MSRYCLWLVLGTFGCKDKGTDSGADARPDPVCNDATGYSGGEAFADATDSWGLDGVTGTRFVTADLDGDGYPDLIVSEGESFLRDDFDAGTRYRWLLMNRDDGAGGRIFVDETRASGLFAVRDSDDDNLGRPGQVHAVADVDNDGDLDVFSGHFNQENADDNDERDRSEIMLNNGDGTFELGPVGDFNQYRGYATSGASFADVDADGDVDLWITGWYKEYGYLTGEQDHLYLNDGSGSFSEATAAAGLEMIEGDDTQDWLDGLASRPAFGATACDLDGDSYPDLLASNYGRAWNQQWMNQGDGTFVDVSLESGYAGDDNLDYSDNQFYRCYCEVYGCDPDPGSASLAGCDTYAAYWGAGWDDQPYRNNGNTFSTVCGDVDNDGDMDLMTAEIKHWHIGEGSDESELLLNDGTGMFTRPGNTSNGLERDWDEADWNEGDLWSAFFDFDHDGWKDVILVTTEYPYTRMFLWRQVAQGEFEELAEDAGIDREWPAGIAIADFDLDGDLDVVSGASTSRSGTPWEDHALGLYENTLGSGNHSRILLVGDGANAAGIGARVEVSSGSLTQTFEVSGGYGHMGAQHDTALSVGLADSCDDLEITVTWPGGAVDTWTGVRANYTLTLHQGGEVEYL